MGWPIFSALSPEPGLIISLLLLLNWLLRSSKSAQPQAGEGVLLPSPQLKTPAAGSRAARLGTERWIPATGCCPAWSHSTASVAWVARL